MKKVLKLSSLLAAVLLLAALAGVQLLTAQAVRTSVDVEMDYVSNDVDATNSFVVTVSDVGELRMDGNDARFATVTVENLTRMDRPDDKDKEGNKLELTAQNLNENDEVNVDTVSGATTTASTTVSVFASTTDVGYMDTDTDTVMGIIAKDGDRIRVRYTPKSGRSRTDTVTVDGTGPVITSQSPAHKTRTKADAVAFVVEFKDDGVGLGKEADVDANTTLALEDESEDFKITDLEDGNWRIRAVILIDEGTVDWRVTVMDTLGNMTVSDAVKDDPDTPDVSELEPQHSVTVDQTAPKIDTATTGDTLDTSGEKAIVKDGAGNRNSIAVKFNEDLNGSSVQATDFRVEVDKLQQSISGVVWHADVKDHVFITLEDELAGDAEPTVRVVGPIEDTAGVAQATTEKVAEDGIAPMLSVDIEGTGEDKPVTNGTLTIRVSSDENARTPSRSAVVVQKVTAVDGDKMGTVAESTKGASTFRTITSGEHWEWTFKFNKEDGLYNVSVTISDISGTAGNAATSGLEPDDDSEVDTSSDKILVFEVDSGIGLGKKDDGSAKAIADVVTPASTDNTGAFIEVDMTGEGSEYPNDSHGTITALSATVGGSAVEVVTLDNKTFTIAPPVDGYAVGEHDVVVTASDETGNTMTFKKVTVEITERAAFTINLRPGYNLISLPGAPESTDINDVIGADHAINQVLTYSPFVEGGWLSAERGDDGAFAGTLTTIDGSTAYIVRTTSFEPLEVTIPRMVLGNVLPPQTNLAVGWNLVPVIDLTSEKKAGAKIVGYFQGVGEAILTIGNAGILETVDDDVAVVGKGYWVYASRPAVLLPTQR